jgi:hypothetical protein
MNADIQIENWSKFLKNPKMQREITLGNLPFRVWYRVGQREELAWTPTTLPHQENSWSSA